MLGGAQSHTSCSLDKCPNHLDHQHYWLLLALTLHYELIDQIQDLDLYATAICSQLHLTYLHICSKHLSDDIAVLYGIVVFGATPKDHLTTLREVFKMFTTAGLKLKPSKCDFFKISITYLGDVVSKIE